MEYQIPISDLTLTDERILQARVTIKKLANWLSHFTFEISTFDPSVTCKCTGTCSFLAYYLRVAYLFFLNFNPYL